MYLDMDDSKWSEGVQSDLEEVWLHQQVYLPPRSGLPLRQFARLRRQRRRILVEFALGGQPGLRVGVGLILRRREQGQRRSLLWTIRASSVPVEVIFSHNISLPLRYLCARGADLILCIYQQKSVEVVIV